MHQQTADDALILEADLRDWEQTHAVALDEQQDGFALTDCPVRGHHLISFACPERLNFQQAVLRFQVKATAECRTNLVIHEYGSSCIAILDLVHGTVLAGLALQKDLVTFQPLEDGWQDVRVRMPRGRSFHTYIGTADGVELVYEGFNQPQFLLRNPLRFRLLQRRELKAQHPELTKDDPLVIVDVGAAGGLQQHWEDLLVSDAGEGLAAYLFEPGTSQADELEILYHHYPNVHTLRHALAASSGTAQLHITRFPDCSSALRPNGEVLKGYAVRSCFDVVAVETMQFTCFGDLLRAGRVAAPDVLKLDVQGLEYEVLVGCGQALHTCLAVELETHFYPIYEGQRLIGDIVALLAAFGMRLRRLTPQPSFDADLVEVNAIFSRDPTTISDARRAEKLAVIQRVLRLKHHPEGARLAACFPTPAP